jgi:TPR repeat protein
MRRLVSMKKNCNLILTVVLQQLIKLDKCNYSGHVVDQDYEKGFYYFSLGRNYTKSFYYVGFMSQHGIGTAKDDEKAVSCYKKLTREYNYLKSHVRGLNVSTNIYLKHDVEEDTKYYADALWWNNIPRTIR